MFLGSPHRTAKTHGTTRKSRRQAPTVTPLEGRWLLSTVMDLTTTATVTAYRAGVGVVEPQSSAYATSADAVQIGFTAVDPDNPTSTPTTHFNITDTTTGAVVASGGTGNSFALSAQGVYQVQYWSTDADDSEPQNAHSILIAIDRSAPIVDIQSVTPDILWPPNGKFVAVTVTGVAMDNLSGVNASSLGFNVLDSHGMVEPSGAITNVVGSDPTAFGGYGEVSFSFQVMLQARRYGFDFGGRDYVIVAAAGDMAGNAGMDFAIVTVPHDMGRHHGDGHGPINPVPLRGDHHHGGGDRADHHHGDQGFGGVTVPVIGLPVNQPPIVPVMGPILGPGGQGDGNGGDNGNGHGNGTGHGNGNGGWDHGNGHGHGHG